MFQCILLELPFLILQVVKTSITMLILCQSKDRCLTTPRWGCLQVVYPGYVYSMNQGLCLDRGVFTTGPIPYHIGEKVAEKVAVCKSPFI